LQLLADEQNKIEYIARVLGFSERSAFERAFRQWFTITPAQFRFETMQCKLQAIPEGGALDKLPPLPKIAQEIVLLMQKESYDMRQLVALVQQDPVLSARVLGLANSAYYGAGRVQNLNDAISRVLGTDTVRNLVLVSMCSEPFHDSSAKLFDRTQHWLMAFGVAQLAQTIAKANKTATATPVDAVQLLGLLHNLGILLLAYTRPHEVDKLLTQAEAIHHESEWTALEMRLLGIDRYIAATVLLTHWHLPTDLCRRMRQLSDAPMGSDDAVVEMVYQAIEFVAAYLRLYTSKEKGLTEAKQKQLLMDFFVEQISVRWQLSEEKAQQVTQDWLDKLPLLAQTAELMK
jgi:HD-like signal output (HDOD) protein